MGNELNTRNGSALEKAWLIPFVTRRAADGTLLDAEHLRYKEDMKNFDQEMLNIENGLRAF